MPSKSMEWLKDVFRDPSQTAEYAGHEIGRGYRQIHNEIHTWEAGWNRGHEREFRNKFRENPGEFSLGFTSTSAEYEDGGSHVRAVAYDPVNHRMKVTFAKAGKEGPVVIYDVVPDYVYESLEQMNARTGHCGKMLWSFLRIRGTKTGTRVPYWHEE